jgi:DNA-binding MarR family transcriptional regulator/GNAT superfamily N-acetyltransferase
VVMESAARDRRIGEVRAFNRFYTSVIGLLEPEHLHTPYTLTEARLIFELAQRDRADLRDLRELLGLDAGYLTRLVQRFESAGLVGRERSASDARRQVVWLTKDGRAAYRTLNDRSEEQIGALLARLPEPEQHRLIGAMTTIRDLLAAPRPPASYLLRPPEAGDLGWVVARNAAIYAAEYGWDDAYEALVARIVADYVEHRDPDHERAWIAELAGVPVGCVFCVRADRSESPPRTAKLRLLLVEPSARGLGIGARLVDECLRYATRAGYQRMVLWTNDVLTQARHIYQRAGFELVETEKHHSFGHDLTGETWSRELFPASG